MQMWTWLALLDHHAPVVKFPCSGHAKRVHLELGKGANIIFADAEKRPSNVASYIA